MSLQSLRALFLAFIAALLVSACGGSSSSSKAPPPPVDGISVVPGDSQVTVTWKETPGVEYWIFAAPNSPNLSLTNWLATTGSTYRLKVTSPFVVTGLANDIPYSFFLTGRVNSGPGGAATPTVISTPRLAGNYWTTGTTLNTGNPTGLTYGTYVDTAANTYAYSYLAVGKQGGLYKATSIDTWTAITPIVTTDLRTAEFGISKFIAAGAGGTVIYSTDLQTWTQATSVTTQNINAMAASPSMVIAVGDNGTIIKSADAISWTTAATVPSSAHLFGVAYSGSGVWVAVGATGTILTSIDGDTWISQTSGNNANLRATGVLSTLVNNTYTYQYLAVGDSGTILRSVDGITWTTQPAVNANTLNAVSAINQFLVVGNNGTIITSPDGITWSQKTSTTQADLKTLLRAANQYIAVNTAGGIISSQ
jgi:hypothetical protein